MLSRVFAEKLAIRVPRSNTNTLSNLIRPLSTSTPSGSGSGSNSKPKSNKFKPTRRAPAALRKSLAPKPKIRSKKEKAPIPLSGKKGGVSSSNAQNVGPDTTSALEYLTRYGHNAPDHESFLRTADFMTADLGTTEDLVGKRRAMMDALTPEEAEEFKKNMEQVIADQSELDWEDDYEWNQTHEQKMAPFCLDEHEEKKDTSEDPQQKAFGPWSETIIRVDRVQKVERGGTIVRYRALVIGGNLNGCAGFGVAKASAPNVATAKASRIAKRNVFFVDRYLGTGLTSDLVGKHNSCKVYLWATNPNRGLHGHPLVQEILKYFGISDCSAKSHGNRNVYNVVRATFKAIMTHESMEEISLKRGKRLINLERAKRLQI